jgi:hypothetical protein
MITVNTIIEVAKNYQEIEKNEIKYEDFFKNFMDYIAIFSSD